jgi:hypothetical protein
MKSARLAASTRNQAIVNANNTLGQGATRVDRRGASSAFAAFVVVRVTLCLDLTQKVGDSLMRVWTHVVVEAQLRSALELEARRDRAAQARRGPTKPLHDGAALLVVVVRHQEANANVGYHQIVGDIHASDDDGCEARVVHLAPQHVREVTLNEL